MGLLGASRCRLAAHARWAALCCAVEACARPVGCPYPTLYPTPAQRAEPAARARRRRAEPEAEESRPPKRARFSDVQRAALEALAERAQWALPSLSREEKEAFCEQHGMTKARTGAGVRVRVAPWAQPCCPGGTRAPGARAPACTAWALQAVPPDASLQWPREAARLESAAHRAAYRALSAAARRGRPDSRAPRGAVCRSAPSGAALARTHTHKFVRPAVRAR